jgi:hypothetical protein
MLKALVSGFLALALATGANAQEAVTVSLPGTHQYDLVSATTGHPYRLYVSTPDGYAEDDMARYPVLYLLDGYLSFPAAVSARASMDMFGELERAIIVGIGDGEHAFDSWFTNRWRDYTPSADPAADSSAAQSFGQPLETVHSGGGPDFLRVLREEVLPFIDETYRTSPDRGLSGHSFGGLLATYVLFEAPDLFQRYGINSPSLWWHGEEMFETEAAFAETHTALPAHVFLSVGSEEGRSMVQSMERLAEILRSRGYEGLTVDAVVFEDETHTSVVPAMVARTLRVLYALPASAPR